MLHRTVPGTEIDFIWPNYALRNGHSTTLRRPPTAPLPSSKLNMPGAPSQARPIHVIKTPFGPSSELPLQAFLDGVLPPLRHSLNPEKVLKSLQSGEKSSRIITEQGRWRGFANDPKHSDHSILRTFKPLESVVKSIVEACSQVITVDKPTLCFESNSTSVAKSRYHLGETFPHAFFLEGPELSWHKIAVCGEYRKKEDSESVQDVSIVRFGCVLTDHLYEDYRQRDRQHGELLRTRSSPSIHVWFRDQRHQDATLFLRSE